MKRKTMTEPFGRPYAAPSCQAGNIYYDRDFLTGSGVAPSTTPIENYDTEDDSENWG